MHSFIQQYLEYIMQIFHTFMNSEHSKKYLHKLWDIHVFILIMKSSEYELMCIILENLSVGTKPIIICTCCACVWSVCVCVICDVCVCVMCVCVCVICVCVCDRCVCVCVCVIFVCVCDLCMCVCDVCVCVVCVCVFMYIQIHVHWWIV
jgi:hypothetical protein